MDRKETMNLLFEDSIEQFSENYLGQIAKKESYDLHDIREAFTEGAKWMMGFYPTAEHMLKRLI